MTVTALDSLSVSQLKGVGAKVSELLHKLGIQSVQDLLFHLPLRYEDRTRLYPIADLWPQQTATVQGEEAAAKPLKVGSFSFSVGAPWKESDTPGPMSQGTIETPGKDGAPGLKASFYHFGPGQGGALSGNIERWQGMFQ